MYGWTGLILAAVVALAAGVLLGRWWMRRRRPSPPSGEARDPGFFPPAPLSVSPPGPEEDGSVATDQFLYERCCRYMVEHRPFLVDTFSLKDLAGALASNRTYLSQTINYYSGRYFRNYVNYYRVMYAMELFRQNPTLRIAELSMLSGFGTQSTFTRAFTALMKETPREWCARYRRKYVRDGTVIHPPEEKEEFPFPLSLS